jgi:N-acetyl sugar amidotransferase
MEPNICTKCLMLSTRPRLTFDGNGVCSACQWAEEKKTTVDWEARKKELHQLCSKYRSLSGFDVVVPVSGGKDSSMVAHRLKHELGMTPLCINISHSLQCLTALNDINLNNFIAQGFDCLRVYPNQEILRKLDRVGLEQYGRPLFGWLTVVVLAPIKIALLHNIPFVMYGEDGEVEYGGSTALKNVATYSIEDAVRFYLSGVHPETYLAFFSEKELFWWLPPKQEELARLEPDVAHWSYFENWNSNFNYEYAKKHVGLKVRESTPADTYVTFAQNDSILYPLHTYFMYLKFGFGRCSQDVCIDIRAGKISREEGLALVQQYDEAFPEEYWEQYLSYYELAEKQMSAIIDKFANKNLLKKKNGRWVKKFSLN